MLYDYALALYNTACKLDIISTIELDLEELSSIVLFLQNKQIPIDKKIVISLVSDNLLANDTMVNFINTSDISVLYDIQRLSAIFSEIKLKNSNLLIIQSAIKLSQSDINIIQSKAEKKFLIEVHNTSNIINKEIIAGFILIYKDTVWDFTVDNVIRGLTK